MYDFAWLQSKTGTEAMTASSDGRVLWWDTRRLGEPREELPLAERGVPSGALVGAVSLDYSPAAGPTKCAAFPFCAHFHRRSGPIQCPTCLRVHCASDLVHIVA